MSQPQALERGSWVEAGGADTRRGVARCSGSPQRRGPYCDGSGSWLSPFVCTLAWRAAGLADLLPHASATAIGLLRQVDLALQPRV